MRTQMLSLVAKVGGEKIMESIGKWRRRERFFLPPPPFAVNHIRNHLADGERSRKTPSPVPKCLCPLLESTGLSWRKISPVIVSLDCAHFEHFTLTGFCYYGVYRKSKKRNTSNDHC